MTDERSTDLGDRIDQAERRLDRRLSPEHRRRYASHDAPTSDPTELQAEQFRETDEITVGPGVPVMTGPMGRGMVGGGVLGAVIGGLVAVPIGFLPIMSQPLVVRLVVVVLIGVAAGSTAGAVYFGARFPELSGESFDTDNRPSAGSSLRDPNTDERGR